VEITRFDERPRTGDVAIEAIIHVERDSQKGILIGRKGAMIKQIGSSAREEIGRILDCPVHLKLTIHVEKEWTRSVEGRRRLGYDS
jgi:GTP-binding protein Era